MINHANCRKSIVPQRNQALHRTHGCACAARLQIRRCLWLFAVALPGLLVSAQTLSAQRGPAAAQPTDTNRPASAVAALPRTVRLQYGDPVPYSIGSVGTTILDRLTCGSDGTVYVPTMEPPEGQSRFGTLAIAALTPSKEVVRYVPQNVAGFQTVTSAGRYFVSRDHIYLLVLAEKMDASDSRKISARVYLIQVFDRKGHLTDTLSLDADVVPVNLMAFESGEVVVWTTDKLNRQTRLLLLDSLGRTQSEWKMFDHDFAGKMEQASRSDRAYAAEGVGLSGLLAGAQIISHGDNLLLGTFRTTLPPLDVSPKGHLTALPLALPPDMLLVDLLPSDDGLLHVAAGSYAKGVQPIPAGEAGAGFRPFTTSEVDVFVPQDGSLLRRYALLDDPGAPMPVCAANGEYTFLAPRESDGKLQLIHASPAP